MAFEIRSGIAGVDFETVHSWLKSSYWSPGISRDRVERAAQNSSMVIGAYIEEQQAGYCRIVSDRTTFAWVCDVWVSEAHRGQGIARAMIAFAMADPEHQGLRRWLLATKDAHGVYQALGFEPLPEPARWMVKALRIP